MKRIEDAFKEYTSRDDVAIVMINQFIANMIRHLISNYSDVRTRWRPAFFLFSPSLLALYCCWSSATGQHARLQMFFTLRIMH